MGLKWRCLKEGLLFNERYEIHRQIKGYRSDALNPRRFLGSSEDIAGAKQLCETFEEGRRILDKAVAR